MSAPPQTATRTYLEMRDRSAFRPAPGGVDGVRVERVSGCPPSFWRYLYTEVGRQYYWTDRLVWSDDDINAYLNDPDVSLWLMTVAGAPSGYFELRRGSDAAVEIAYFGLLPEFTGRGLGKALLSAAVERAWESGASRVWLHTSSLDHAAALPNYLQRGFTIVRKEEYTVTPR